MGYAATAMSFREFWEKWGASIRKQGCFVCYGMGRTHSHDRTKCDVAKRERAAYFERNFHKTPPRDQRNQPGKAQLQRQYPQLNAEDARYAELMAQIQGSKNRLPQSGP